MPIYEYQCPQCGAEVEVMQRISAPPPDCKACEAGPMKKRISAPAFQFKGDGWYVTDYARKDKEQKKNQDKGAGSDSSGKSSESGSEKKSESKPAPKSESKTSSSSSSGSD